MAPADDCYALGLVFYCMLTGEPPNKFPSVPKTLLDPAALHLLKIAEKACTPPGFPDASEFLEQPACPARPEKEYAPWKWVVMGIVTLLIVLVGLCVWRFAATPKEPLPPSVPLSKPAALPEKVPLPEAPALVDYAPEVVALLKKHQLTEEEEAEQKRHMLPYLGLDSERAKQTRRDIVAVTGTTAEADRIFEQEMAVISLLEKIGTDTPTPVELERLERALQRRKQMYSPKNP